MGKYPVEAVQMMARIASSTSGSEKTSSGREARASADARAGRDSRTSSRGTSSTRPGRSTPPHSHPHVHGRNGPAYLAVQAGALDTLLQRTEGGGAIPRLLLRCVPLMWELDQDGDWHGALTRFLKKRARTARGPGHTHPGQILGPPPDDRFHGHHHDRRVLSVAAHKSNDAAVTGAGSAGTCPSPHLG